MSFKRLSRALVGTVALGAIATQSLIAANSGGLALSATQTVAPENRVVEAPGVAFPAVSQYATDLKSFGKRPGTVINAPCGSAVLAAHAGTAYVGSSPSSGPNLVRVVTSRGKLVSYYGFMRKARVTNGQIVAAGQQIGNIGDEGTAKACSLYFAISNGGVRIDPSRWLNNWVGKPVPQRSLFENNGFVVASFNTLGASHTPAGARYPGYSYRTPRQVTMLQNYNVDVVGLQEFESSQRSLFLATAGDTYGIWPAEQTKYSANSIIWRNSTMEFVSGTTFGIPYFEGRIWQMPVALLKDRATGRTAYFIDVHNPASIPKYGDQSKWRHQAIAIERAKVQELRATGRPVFLVGDFNDRADAFCPLTEGKLMISANSIPSMTCALPKTLWIDWVYAAGPARFTQWVKDMTPKEQKISDHPIILTRAYLSE